MSKTYFFLSETPAAESTTPTLPDVYCPTGGYFDKNLNKAFTSRGEKYRYLRSHGMREAEMAIPGKALGGTDGRAVKARGSKGTFAARPMPAWMRKELAQHVG